MEEVSIGLAYMHPVCPLSLNHARLFVIADTYARFQRLKGNNVHFPIGMHYSGIEPITLSEKIKNALKRKDSKYLEKLRKSHNIESRDLTLLTNPIDLLNYFSERQINDLERLGITSNFERVYNTKETRYEEYLEDLFNQYKSNKAITNTTRSDALVYSDRTWRDATKTQLIRTKVTKESTRKILEERLEHFFGEYEFLRDKGIGKDYAGKIIEPMSDSELFHLFEYKEGLTNLPLDIFFMEEHLKTFAIKRMFAETLILQEDLRTKAYFILGMGSYGGQRISASKGIGDTLPTLLEKYGRNLTRISLLLVSHPSKNFNWNDGVPHFSRKILDKYNLFKSRITELPEGNDCELDRTIIESMEAIKENIQNGDYRTACLKSLVELPKKIRKIAPKVKGELEKYKNYVDDLFGLN